MILESHSDKLVTGFDWLVPACHYQSLFSNPVSVFFSFSFTQCVKMPPGHVISSVACCQHTAFLQVEKNCCQLSRQKSCCCCCCRRERRWPLVVWRHQTSMTTCLGRLSWPNHGLLWSKSYKYLSSHATNKRLMLKWLKSDTLANSQTQSHNQPRMWSVSHV